MVVEFLEKFYKDLDKIGQSSVKSAVIKTIERVENARGLSDIPNIKKLSGYKTAYRIRVGDYRIGVFAENGVVQFARIIHRKDIYKLFP